MMSPAVLKTEEPFWPVVVHWCHELLCQWWQGTKWNCAVCILTTNESLRDKYWSNSAFMQLTLSVIHSSAVDTSWSVVSKFQRMDPVCFSDCSLLSDEVEDYCDTGNLRHTHVPSTRQISDQLCCSSLGTSNQWYHMEIASNCTEWGTMHHNRLS